jgi:hypothetical protein
MKRWLFLLFVLPQCTGCLGYVYPTVAYTPEVVVPNQDSSAHAFRVDIDRSDRKEAAVSTVSRVTPAYYNASTEYTLTRIALDTRGIVPSQLEIAPVTGVYNPFGFPEFKEHEHNKYTMTVRFYRPGHQTMEVKSWDKARTLQWSVAPDLMAQEKAIDDLLADPAAVAVPMQQGTPAVMNWWDLKDSKTPPLGLRPGAVSASQRHALLFAANEYQRLSTSPTAGSLNMQPLRERLQQKAIWLRRYAEQTQVQ